MPGALAFSGALLWLNLLFQRFNFLLQGFSALLFFVQELSPAGFIHRF
jgi:hypothetical protein